VDKREGDNLDSISYGSSSVRNDQQGQDQEITRASYSDPFLEEKIFPHLFPKGVGGYKPKKSTTSNADNEDNIPMNQYNKIRLLSIHPAFRNSPMYIFFREDVLIKKLLFSYQNRVLLSQAERQMTVTRGDLLGPNGSKYGNVMPASIHGTDEYFASKFLDLCAFMAELGKPDLFVTLSSNDFDDNLVHFLAGKDPRGCPVECDLFFFEKLGEALKLMKDIFHVKDYWYRIEYQNRGSPHAHILIWTDPKISLEEVDHFVFATIPHEKDPLSLKIAELVRKYQLHNCTQKCLKDGKCKYGFPFSTRSSTSLSQDGKFVLYRRIEKEDERVVPYHPSLLLLLNSHINVQMTTTSGAGVYVSKYAAKAEPTQTIQTQGKIENFFRLRRLSINNAIDNLLGKHATHGTREVLFLSTQPRTKMRRLLKSKEQLLIDEETGASEDDIFHETFRDKYMARPNELEEMKIVEYLKVYQIFPPGAQVPKKRKEEFGILIDLNNRQVLKRSKEVLVRTKMVTINDGEEFYHDKLIQQVPFRSEEFISPENRTQTYKEECFRRGIIEDGEEVEDSLRGAHERGYSNDQILKLAFSLLSSASKKEIEEVLDRMEIPGFESYIQQRNLQANPSLQIEEALDLDQVQVDLEKETEMMTPSQKRVFEKLKKSISSNAQSLLCIQGPGGTGKSFLIESIKKLFQVKGKRIKLTASSASASRLIRGTTVHFLFALNPALESSLEYGTYRFHDLSQTDLIIIDEMSMITSKLLLKVDELCRKTTNRNLPFGGMSILLFGDFFQLPPVIKPGSLDQPIYESPLFAYFQIFQLTENCRQVEDPDFAQCLNRIRLGKQVKEDIDLLKQRVCGKGHPQGDNCTSSMITVCPKRAQCERINKLQLDRLPGTFRTFEADDSIPITSEMKKVIEMRDLLPTKLCLKVGARVILLRNIRLEEGLINGIIGEVTEIQENYIRVAFDGLGENLINKFRQTIKPPGFTTLTRRQFPLDLAWAITAHKVQGMTFDNLRVLTEDMFEEGQAYVCFSRVRKREGLHLISFDNTCIKTSKKCPNPALRNSKTCGKPVGRGRKKARKNKGKRVWPFLSPYLPLSLGPYQTSVGPLSDGNIAPIDFWLRPDPLLFLFLLSHSLASLLLSLVSPPIFLSSQEENGGKWNHDPCHISPDSLLMSSGSS